MYSEAQKSESTNENAFIVHLSNLEQNVSLKKIYILSS